MFQVRRDFHESHGHSIQESVEVGRIMTRMLSHGLAPNHLVGKLCPPVGRLNPAATGPPLITQVTGRGQVETESCRRE